VTNVCTYSHSTVWLFYRFSILYFINLPLVSYNLDNFQCCYTKVQLQASVGKLCDCRNMWTVIKCCFPALKISLSNYIDLASCGTDEGCHCCSRAYMQLTVSSSGRIGMRTVAVGRACSWTWALDCDRGLEFFTVTQLCCCQRWQYTEKLRCLYQGGWDE